jgi:molecular chaperone DnaK
METIELSKKVIQDSNVKRDAIKKVILVGAPTLTPLIRHLLAKELNVKVDATMNPFTVVAEGAAIFALSQKVPQKVLDKNRFISSDEIQASYNVEAMTSETNLLVTGKIDLKQEGEFFIKISSDAGFWHSEKIKLKNNSFSAKVSLELQKQNLFWVYLIDNQGNNLNIQPSSFTITQGMNLNGAPIPHEVGIIYSEKQANGTWVPKCFPYFNRKATLPLTKSTSFKTISDIDKGEKVILPIEVYEGDYEDPKLNQIVTRIKIDGEKLPYALKKGSSIEIKIEITESRVLSVEVYIPDLDLELNARVDAYEKAVELNMIDLEFQELESEANSLQENMSEEQKLSIDQEMSRTKKLMDNVPDNETKQKIQKQIKSMKNDLQVIRHSTSFDRLLNDYEDIIKKIDESIENVSSESDKTKFKDVFEKVQQQAVGLIEIKQEITLKRVIDELKKLYQAVISSTPDYWVGFLMYIMQRKDSLKNQSQANSLIQDANNAIDENDVDKLRQAVIQLANLLPDDNDGLKEKITGITR